jgi:hypothetical protein
LVIISAPSRVLCAANEGDAPDAAETLSMLLCCRSVAIVANPLVAQQPRHPKRCLGHPVASHCSGSAHSAVARDATGPAPGAPGAWCRVALLACPAVPDGRGQSGNGEMENTRLPPKPNPTDPECMEPFEVSPGIATSPAGDDTGHWAISNRWPVRTMIGLNRGLAPGG